MFVMSFTLRSNFVCYFGYKRIIVGKGGHIPPFLSQPSPFSEILPLLETQDVPTFYRPIRKTKVLSSFNQLLYNFYPRSILIFEKYLLEW